MNLKAEYLISIHGVIERGLFYNYMQSMGYRDAIYTRKEIIESSFPFAVSLKKKRFFILTNPTVCFLLQQKGKFRTEEEIKEILNKRKKV